MIRIDYTCGCQLLSKDVKHIRATCPHHGGEAIIPLKKCWKCKKRKQITEFYGSTYKRDFVESRCKECNAKHCKEHRLKKRVERTKRPEGVTLRQHARAGGWIYKKDAQALEAALTRALKENREMRAILTEACINTCVTGEWFHKAARFVRKEKFEDVRYEKD